MMHAPLFVLCAVLLFAGAKAQKFQRVVATNKQDVVAATEKDSNLRLFNGRLQTTQVSNCGVSIGDIYHFCDGGRLCATVI